jgi:hypothetical protein
MYPPLLRKEFKTTQIKTTYINTTLRYIAPCVSGVVSVEVGAIVGTLPFSLESQNLRHKVQSIPDIMLVDSPAQY